MARERIKTYIQGLDDEMDGGIPENSIVLLLGEPGTMKSSIAYYILYKNAIYNGIKGTYVTLEQSRTSLMDHVEGLGMDTSQVKTLISIVDLSLIRKKQEELGQHTWIHIFKMYAQNIKKSMGYKILVLDSLPVLSMLSNFKNPRNEMFQMIEWLRDLNSTILLISEMSQSGLDFGQYGEDFLADGIILLKMDSVDDITVQRRIRCVKMRSSHHNNDYFTLLFGDGEFQVTRVISDF
jgi:KaiC/GvpD/RAD55 family RecA-like ATPase